MLQENEVRFGENEMHFENTVIRSAILPQNSKELSRSVRFDGNVTIEGGVFGKRISVDGENVVFKSALYSNSEVYVKNDIKGTVRFEKAVASADAVSAFLMYGRAIFNSDINAQVVRLKNCFVGGSIFAKDVYIEDCVVLGGVFATKKVSVSNCMIGTFYAADTELSGINYMLYPTGFSTEPITYLPGTELYNISLAHLGALYKGEPEDANTGKIRIDLVNDKLETVLTGEDGVNTILNSYSVSGRVLVADVIDIEKLENHFLIGTGALGPQILKAYSLTTSDGTKTEELTSDSVANFMFDILSGKIQIQDLNGEISFEEIKKTFE